MQFEETFTKHSFVIIGHRGAAGVAPENSLQGFEYALQLGCHGIELDVHRVQSRLATQDLAVIHDPRLDRTTDASGKVSKLDLEDLQGINVGDGRGLPTLSQVISLYESHHQHTLLNVELKGIDTATIAAKLLMNSTLENLLVSSFSHDELFEFCKLAPAVPVAPLYAKWQKKWYETAQQLNAKAVNLSADIVNPQRVKDIKSAGYKLLVYTVNTKAQARQLKDMGVDGIFTDFPNLWLTGR